MNQKNMPNMIIPCNSTEPRPFKLIEGQKREDYMGVGQNLYCINTEKVKFNNDRNYMNYSSF